MANLLIDPKGRQKGVVLTVREYKRLLARLEDLEDALELKQSNEEAEDFEELREVLKRLDSKKRA